MKRSRKLVSLLTVAAFIVMALVPAAALAEAPPAEDPAVPVISEVTLDVKTPATGEAPSPADGSITDVAAFASASGAAAEPGGDPETDPGTTRSAQQAREGAEPIEEAFSAAEITWSAVDTPAESRAGLEKFEAETAYKAVVTLTLDSAKAALPETVSAETVKVTLGAPAGGGAARAAEPTITPSESDGKLVVTIEFPATAAAEPEPAAVPEISAVTLTGIVAPATGEAPEPPAGEIENVASFASATGAAASEGGGAGATVPESREAAEAIAGAFSKAEIGWSAVDAAEDAAPVEKFEAETQYQAVVTLAVNTENASLPADASSIAVQLSAGSAVREAGPEITAAVKDESTLEITIVFPATEKETDEPGTEDADGWTASEGQNYTATAEKTWIQWYAGSSTMPYLEAGLTGPEKPDSITYEWSADGTPIEGQTGSRLELTSKLLGTDFSKIKKFSATVTATKDGQEIKVASNPVRFSVLVAPANAITFFCEDSPEPNYGYLIDYTPKIPTLSVSAIGETEGADLTYNWTDGAGKTVSTEKEFIPTAEQLGSVRATKTFKCEVTAEASGQEVKTYNNPLAFTVEVYVNDLTVTGPRSVSAGQSIDITVSAPGLTGLSGSVVLTGLTVTKVSGSPFSNAENVLLLEALGSMTATYTCQVTASAGQPVSFVLDKVTLSSGEADYSAKNVSWTATVPGSSQPSPTRPNTPVNPGGSGGGAPIVPPPAVTAQPSPSPSPAPSEPAPTPAPSAAPSAPVQLAPDAPGGLKVEANPDGSGTILTGVDISTMRDTFSTSDLAELIEVPEGGSVEVLDADGSPALRNTRVATGMIVRVIGKDGQPIEQSVVVVPGDVTGTGLMNLSQVVTMAKALTGQIKLEGVYELAGDLDGNGRITITDVVMEANMYVRLGLQG